jgi:hypothetical protein
MHSKNQSQRSTTREILGKGKTQDFYQGSLVSRQATLVVAMHPLVGL